MNANSNFKNNINSMISKDIFCLIFKFILFFILGVFLYIIFFDRLSLKLIMHITSLLNSHSISNDFKIFAYEIIVNSVDIFKISFIIIISGVTYIYDIISNICVVAYGLFYGFSASLCISYIVNTCTLSNSYGEILLLVLKLFLLITASIYCFVMSKRLNIWLNHRSADRFLLVNYKVLINYLFSTLILFGYVIILELLFRFVYKFFY